MSIEAVVVSAVMILLALYLVITPFRSTQTVSPAALQFQRQRDALLVYYQQVTSSLRDLQEDSASGKIPPEEFEVEHEKWMQRGVQILQALQELDRDHLPLMVNAETPVEDVNQAIEDAVQQYLKRHPNPALVAEE
ncbi:MAG: hypothetical protein KA401_01645 [Anaerolineae bacterium]|nr:hypothetical protein [Chloroflexota bacterium]MBP6298022.1 hypothetical protein [Anaerolineae bacterium]